MAKDFSHLVNILVQPPGNLIYLLVIGLGLALTGVSAIPKLNTPKIRKSARHVLVGCSILLILQIILFSASQLESLSSTVLTLLECLTSLLTIIWILWLFHEDDQRFSLTGKSIYLTLALFILTMINLLLINSEEVYIPLLTNFIILTWHMAALILIALGIIFTFRKRPPQWMIALCILSLLAFGHLLYIILYKEQGFQMGAVRLGQIMSLPWITILISRFDGRKLDEGDILTAPKAFEKDRRVDPKPTLVDYLLKIPLQETPQEKYQAVARAISLSVVADICCLFRVEDETGSIDLIAGYDLIREENLRFASILQESLSYILAAWREGRPLKFSKAYHDSRDTETLKSLINYPRLGNVLAYPLFINQGQLSGGVLLLSPYTDKNWGEDTTALFEEIQPTLAQVLFTPLSTHGWVRDDTAEKETFLHLMREKDNLQAKVEEKEKLIQEQESALKEWQARYQIDKLEAENRLEKMQERLDQLSNQAADQEVSGFQLEQLRANIRHLTNERDQLKFEMATAQAKLNELTASDGQTGPIRLSMDTQVVSLDSIMANVRLQIASQLSASRLHLEIINPDGHQMIKTDPELVQKILYSLLNNAIKASKPGGKIQVRQKLTLETGMLEVQITDYGEGLTEEEQKLLFSPEPEVAPGIGSIHSIREAIRAIRVLNGKIWLKSKQGAYTTFRVHLPVRIID